MGFPKRTIKETETIFERQEHRSINVAVRHRTQHSTTKLHCERNERENELLLEQVLNLRFGTQHSVIDNQLQ